MTTKDEIQTSINSRLKSSPTKMEGGTIQDVIGSVSYEIANIIDTKINSLLDNAFISTSDEEHLLIRGNELGIKRKEATKAIVFATITNAILNTVIGLDIQAKTKDDIIFQTLIAQTVDENGCATVKMECLTEGIAGNILENSLTEFCDIYTGLENAKITNLNNAYNGFDLEEIEDYRERILEYIRNDACNSNIADYKMWAKSIQGVKDVVIQDAFISGAGHVNVYISALNNETVSEELINSVKEKIQKEQIINAIVSVYPLEYLEINISANITLKNGYTIEKIKTEFSEILKNI